MTIIRRANATRGYDSSPANDGHNRAGIATHQPGQPAGVAGDVCDRRRVVYGIHRSSIRRDDEERMRAGQ
jgi:hypothetical protein